MNTDYTMKQAYIEAYQRIWEYEGRSTRSAYWMFQVIVFFSLILLFTPLLTFYSLSFDSISGLNGIAVTGIILLSLATVAWFIVLFIINISLTCRRLADSGKHPLLILVQFVPSVGCLILFILCCLDSERGSNKWGPSLKYPD